ncbi:MAG: ribbon-helix-helix domain-containing protein [Rhodobacteraceae bacterium]|nr:ribbon-helix-helix domain-containing protein [Paracoccaceae bacterium]
MPLVKRSLSLHRHRTSVALEPDFWKVIDEACAEKKIPLAKLVADIDDSRDPEDSLSSSLRVFALQQVVKKL